MKLAIQPQNRYIPPMLGYEIRFISEKDIGGITGPVAQLGGAFDS